MELITPNQRIDEWLRGLTEQHILSPEVRREAGKHFKTSRSFADWELFLRRFFILLGVLMIAAGLIFFMAWNWEDLGRFAKFTILEGVFLIFASYSLLRWNKTASDTSGWDARIALLGAAIMVGGLLALYGQIYQTGADSWELFRAWAFVLLLIALPGRATVFWFMAWLVGSLGLFLYIKDVLSALFENDNTNLLVLALAQFALLALNECAVRLSAERGRHYDSARRLSRIIGCAAIGLMMAYGLSLALDDWSASYLGLAVYLSSLVLTFTVYYLRLPELPFLALSIFSCMSFIGLSLSHALLSDRYGNSLPEIFLPIGLIIIACAFGSLKLLLLVRKHLRARALTASANTSKKNRSALFQFRDDEDRKEALRNWLLARNASTPEALADYFADDEAERENREPWYARVFVTIGVWIGSSALLAFLTLVIFEGLFDQSKQYLGIIGLLFCALSLQLGAGKKLSRRAFSQVLGVCGLIYSCFLLDLDIQPTLFLLFLLFTAFWALKPPYAGRIAAFIGLLTCLFWFLKPDHLSIFLGRGYTELGQGAVYATTFLCWLGLMWAAQYLLLMRGKPLAGRWKLPPDGWLGARLQPEELLSSSAFGCLIFFAVSALLISSSPVRYYVFGVFGPIDFHLAVTAAAASLTVLLCLRFPAARPLALPLGLAVSALALFAPTLALGLGLVLLAFQCGQASFMAAATLYLGLANWSYYYSLQLSLLHKSLVLLAAGLGLLLLALILRPLTRQLKVW